MSTPPPPSSSSPFAITPAHTPHDLSATAALFTTYASSLPFSLSYQSFPQELASLPGAYSPHNGGQILLARSTKNHFPSNSITNHLPTTLHDHSTTNPITKPNETPEEILGCVALRALSPSAKICEMKRLYVTPSARGMGLGTALALAIIDVAREYGYKRMKLDTLSTMTAARGLYGSLGFVETEAYNETPIAETMFFEKVL
ncbi:MAG: hypothetical protein LQ343_003583 [Gyalolechia ehrenbergii]|nr:MAG: hypothetical protein LQ343_003583 [Gyalolechia ehrenbergii]